MVEPLGVPPAGTVPKLLKLRPEGRLSEKATFVAVLPEIVKGMVYTNGSPACEVPVNIGAPKLTPGMGVGVKLGVKVSVGTKVKVKVGVSVKVGVDV